MQWLGYKMHEQCRNCTGTKLSLPQQEGWLMHSRRACRSVLGSGIWQTRVWSPQCERTVFTAAVLKGSLYKTLFSGQQRHGNRLGSNPDTIRGAKWKQTINIHSQLNGCNPSYSLEKSPSQYQFHKPLCLFIPPPIPNLLCTHSDHLLSTTTSSQRGELSM